MKRIILSDIFHRTPLARYSFITLIAGGLLFTVVAATAVVPGDSSRNAPSTHEITEHLDLPRTEPVAYTESNLPYVFDDEVLPGDNIYVIFERLGINDKEALSYLTQSEEGQNALRRLRAGRSVTATISAEGQLQYINLPTTGNTDHFVLERTVDGLMVRQNNDAGTDGQIVHIEMRSGTITHSLFGATDTAGVPEKIASKMAEIFGTDVDFTRDLRQGDQFNVVYESIHEPNSQAKPGKILAAEFTNQGKTYAVTLFREADGNEAYYTPDGRGLNQAFLKYPLEFTRISSSFGKRLHPIKKQWRSHAGTDFAAAKGTPIKASSDGHIKFVGNQNGYGKTVTIQHKGKYSTLYAHMNGFAKGLKPGQRIRQGDVIGYVGMTGWATGPHLHYEIRVNNVPHDPMTIALPRVMPLEKEALVTFKKTTAPFLQRIALLNYHPTVQFTGDDAPSDKTVLVQTPDGQN